MPTTVGQYCIYVADLETSVRFYSDIIGLKVQSRTEIPDVHEAVMAADEGGGRLQLAERYEGGRPIARCTLRRTLAEVWPSIVSTHD